jgi:hypothetical protein
MIQTKEKQITKTFKFVDVWSNKIHTVEATDCDDALRKASKIVNHFGIIFV